ncbi:putative integral membrane protein [Theileria parva strain Muguga]|uniref:putative integral membrane protein n=1 Tax=Theileria parva strain Muguga TaxID=333668 RepID=UPI001C61FFE6|nr:putative integral membrane protein [Theileria parva strain Muguga]EAN33049.2 putative integral membrane protein [Theileria parva strain Muguga]
MVMTLVRLLWIIFFSLCGLIFITGLIFSFRAGQECFSCRILMIWIIFFIFFAFASVCLFFDMKPEYAPPFLDFLYDTKIFGE